ncbi:MAG: S8 family serine peptidase, partial [bacterium]|nr:S8 family serine peptidase [bacterium]
RVLDRNGAGTESGVISAIERAIKLKKRHKIRVINLSLGRPVFESYTLDPLCQAVEAAWEAGIVVVVAAGNEGRNNSFENEGYGTIGSPGNDPYVITVGAMKTRSTRSKGDDAIASYSSKGPSVLDHVVKPDLVAPGNRIISLLAGKSGLPTIYPDNSVPKSYFRPDATDGDAAARAYFRLSGTSMATPMVSGAVALLLEKEPNLTPDQVKARLMKTAFKSFPAVATATDPVTGEVFTSQHDIFTVGAGYLDVYAAVSSNEVAPPEFAARSPIAYL